MTKFENHLKSAPIVAILRGLQPREAVEIAQALVDGGIEIMEVPLNSPQPYESIRSIREAFGDRVYLGAGTVLSEEQVSSVAACGGEFAVAPNCNRSVGAACERSGLDWLPGVYTPTEGFEALAGGAAALKLFPAEMCPPALIKAWLAVFPQETKIIPVGGVHADNIAEYLNVGASAAGIGSSLFKPGDTADAVLAKAKKLVANAETANNHC
ncbi:2-dehydro-3-deoxy-6-phosphogalactonate aldolase [Polycladidibacter hongkongensis]|uniref:2-dehydro-3-deoxy-6-phosphogalactonate aldolase n=1 Tax=Polycladidibacter hongkongensis TaxID=1647556 RepID=UPI00082DCB6D|nr:2-dehydro-3-deoxy-6-phosphogalactonate aldolase [Pseudovibrio hongkongensis]